MADRHLDGIGLANQIARSKGLQARVLWIDATANIDRYNTEAKIVGLVRKIAEVGFNTIVFDIKPISGQTVYPSKFAPRLAEWRGKVLPPEFEISVDDLITLRYCRVIWHFDARVGVVFQA